MKCKEVYFDDELYPKKLRDIVDPPQKLYVLGNEKILNNQCLSIVGSRFCTETGANIARNFARELTKRRYYNR